MTQIPGIALEWHLEQDNKHAGGSSTQWKDMVAPWLRCSIRTGDNIALAGAVIALAERYGKIVIPCLKKDEVNVRSFYVNHPNVRLIPLSALPRLFNDQGLTTPGIGLFFAIEEILPKNSEVDYYEHIYQSFGIPYQARWDKCPINEAAKLIDQIEPPLGEYIFLHEDRTRDICLDLKRIAKDLPIIQPEYLPGRSILAYADLIRNATFSELVDSSFFWMAEHLEGIKGQLRLHRYAKPFMYVWCDFERRQEWTVLA